MGEKWSVFPFQDGVLDFSSPFPPLHQAIESETFDDSLLMASELRTNQDSANYKHVGQKNPNNHVGDEKKIIRRDVERKRRKEMGGLYRNLISLVPYDYIKGKRSTSDRLQETVKYVKDLRKRVEELKAKREELKEMKDYSSSNSLHNSNNVVVKKCSIDADHDDDEACRVTVKHCKAGIEVTLNIASCRRSEVPLSKLLKSILVDGGLSITTCIFTKVDRRLLHCIKAEVVEGRNIDRAQLEQKLVDLVSSH